MPFKTHMVSSILTLTWSRIRITASISKVIRPRKLMAFTGSQDDKAYRYASHLRNQGLGQKHGSRHYLSGSMGIRVVIVVVIFLVSSSSAARSSTRPLLKGQNRIATGDDFDENYYISWGSQLVKFLDNNRSVQLVMDQSSGIILYTRTKITLVHSYN